MERIYDFIHGYQPAYVYKDWFLDNLKLFRETSEAMRQGLIKKHVQLQGWTIDLGLSSKKQNVREISAKVISNLKEANSKKNIELGFSAYSHAILPLCSDILSYLQMKLDFDTIKKYLGKPTWFWPPEGACDSRIVDILLTGFPKMIPVLPNKCLGNLNSEIFKIKLQKKEHKAVVFNVLIKDILMGAPYFKTPPDYVPEEVYWESAQQAMRDPKKLLDVLDVLCPGQKKFILRDWENAESKNALTDVKIEAAGKTKARMKEIKSFVKAKKYSLASFELVSKLKPEKSIDLKEIKPGSWEPTATQENPYPFWSPSQMVLNKLPSEKRYLLKGWLKIMETYNYLFDNIIIDYCARRNIIDRRKVHSFDIKKKIQLVDFAIKNPKIIEIFKETSPALISCFPWHFTTPGEWDNDVGLSLDILQKNIVPNFSKLIAYYEYYVSLYPEKNIFFKLLREMEKRLKKIIEKL